MKLLNLKFNHVYRQIFEVMIISLQLLVAPKRAVFYNYFTAHPVFQAVCLKRPLRKVCDFIILPKSFFVVPKAAVFRKRIKVAPKSGVLGKE